MLETLRKVVEAGMGAMSSKKADALARRLVEQGQAGKEQMSRVARDLAEWSRKNGERLAALVRREIRKQMPSLGVASRSEVESLKKRVAALEGKGTRKTTARKTTAKRTTAARKPSSARKRTT
jgi:polyhydroxyalkanoate synthesis regulator phasin